MLKNKSKTVLLFSFVVLALLLGGLNYSNKSNNLDIWVGEYEFDEFASADINMAYRIIFIKKKLIILLIYI
jgi:hypothetical protein